MYTTDKEHNKEIRKSYGDGYLDGFNDGRKLELDSIKCRIEKCNYRNAVKCVEQYMCQMCKNRLSKDNVCLLCTIKEPSNYCYDENWI